MNVLVDEVRASRKLEEILTNSRSAGRARYTIVHKPLKCEHAWQDVSQHKSPAIGEHLLAILPNLRRVRTFAAVPGFFRTMA